MPKPNLRVVDNDHPHARDLARQRIAEFKLDREKGMIPLPVTNIHDTQGAPTLDVNAVLRRSEPGYGRK